jgi:hypothetical protein
MRNNTCNPFAPLDRCSSGKSLNHALPQSGIPVVASLSRLDRCHRPTHGKQNDDCH